MPRWSRPTRARGLKLAGFAVRALPSLSRPTRARGLKQQAWADIEAGLSRAPRGRVD